MTRTTSLIAAAVAAIALSAGVLASEAKTPAPANNTLTAAETKAGWKLLFNGKDFTGWRFYRGSTVGAPWAVEDGAITITGGSGTDIITAEEFGDFELQYDWKISPKGNSGVIYMVVESDKAPQTYNTGPEMQVLDNDGHADGKIPTHRAGALYDFNEPPTNVTKPVGEWNHAVIKLSKGHITHTLNGKVTAESSYGDDAWRAAVAKTKFKDMPLFGLAKSGHIALQDHGDRVWYRNLKIRKL